MILTFKVEFLSKIRKGTKIHTIREDNKGRWHAGRKIEFWCGNPRNTKCFPYQFATGVCTDVQSIILNFRRDSIFLIDKVIVQNFKELDEFARNDGFYNWDSMKQWFYDQYPDLKDEFRGRLIYFKADTSYSIADDQNSVNVYGQKYIAVKGDCRLCDLKNKLMCNKVPCSYFDREDGQINLIFKKVKSDGTAEPH